MSDRKFANTLARGLSVLRAFRVSVTNASSAFLDVADTAMQALAEQTETLVLLAVPDGNSMTLVRTWRPRDVASVWLETGSRVPMAHSSTGQSFLAALTDERFAAKDPSAEWQDLRKAGRLQLAAQGFTFVKGADRHSDSLTAVAAPEMLTNERALSEVGPALKTVVQKLEQQTGAPRTYD